MTVPRLRASERPTSWWLAALQRRRERMQDEYLDLSQAVPWSSAEEQAAAVKFFNAAFRAEESGLRQAHELCDEVRSFDPALAEVLRLYGDEEGWHRQLLSEFMPYIGGSIQPMGRVTSLFYRLYARAKRMETIVLTNLMFETIGSTTYRMALANVEHQALRQMLTILTRDEAFHVPLNVHFLKCVLARKSRLERLRLRAIHKLLFVSLLLLPLASRPKAQAFDRIPTLELVRGYARMLDAVFAQTPELGLHPPRLLLWALGVRGSDLQSRDVLAASVEAAEAAADRGAVEVSALR
ncbi:MAG: ferritin-like domain-containing protein [Myxococcota bacterium]